MLNWTSFRLYYFLNIFLLFLQSTGKYTRKLKKKQKRKKKEEKCHFRGNVSINLKVIRNLVGLLYRSSFLVTRQLHC